MSKPPKPTDLEQAEVLQRVTRLKNNEYVLKTDTEISGMAEVDIDATSGDNIAIADSITGVKAGVNVSGELKTHDASILAKLALKPLIDYNEITVALSSGDTVETYVFKLGVVTKFTLVVTYSSSARTFWTGLVWS